MENIDIRPSQAKFCKKGAQNNFAKFTVKHLSWSVFLIKFQGWCDAVQLYQKETPGKALSCVFSETFEKTYFVEHVQAENWLKQTKKEIVFYPFTRKHRSKTSFLMQLQTCGPTAFPKGHHHRFFSMKIVKFYRKSLLQPTAVRLLLIFCNIFNKMQKKSLMVTFGDWDWLGKHKNILQKQSHGRVLQKRIFSNFFSKAPVQEPFFRKKFQAVALQLYFKRGSCIGFLSVKYLGLFRTDFL